ncbi:conjugal transfer protein TrbF [Flavisphingomonas formosensis]|uniref:conjugal transfer protein TrbF n=1 Tax=Flavisphingomonas formosensis TaxID=861534 RepID=UPI0012F73022|nr:conjugal transfer protein TrbF [Sphingomonas formosensis]
MLFRRSIQRYGRTPEPETPFQRAGQLWDDRIGSARVQARNWRLMAFGCLGLATALSGGLLWQSLQSRVVPYVVAVDRLGEARAIAPADSGYRPTDPQIAWFLARFVRDVRAVSLDPVLTRANWLEAYGFATRRGGQFLSDYARSADPFGRIGERTVSVEVTSVVRASDRSFQVKWIETVYDRGAFAGTTRWTAMLTVVDRLPASAETLRSNPLGLYVDAIDWSRELEPAVDTAKSASLTSKSAGSSLLPGAPAGESPALLPDTGAAPTARP